jgi:toxin ParE1/3/4
MRLVFTPAAERDLDDIWLGIALDDLPNADRMIDKIRQRSQQLLIFPESGRVRLDIVSHARSLNVGNYLILYQVAGNHVEIIRIVHGARDMTKLL